ncbi:hypothetical protein [Roseibium sp.]|uniref:hypothetical protein n=1 Tax=Roseibium sp. TaxID=1936156 RepID=UPI003D0D40BB
MTIDDGAGHGVRWKTFLGNLSEISGAEGDLPEKALSEINYCFQFLVVIFGQLNTIVGKF